MSTIFDYRAIDQSGELQTGFLPGESAEAVAERVRRMGLRPVSVSPKRAQFAQKELSIPGFNGKKIEALSLFSRQFATMTAAGTPIVRCLKVLEAQTEHKGFKGAIKMIRGDIENGDQLSDAMVRQTEWFSDFYISMVRAGESAGSLPLVLERLAHATESQARLRKKVKSAMAYPTAVGFLIICCVLAMLMFLIPTFAGIFKDLGGELPLPTRIVMGVSGLLTNYFPFVFLGTGLAIWRFRKWKKSESGRLTWDTFKLRLPVFGKLARLTALARFSQSLSVLVSTGVPAVSALEIAKGTAGNDFVAQNVAEIARVVSAGGTLSGAMAEQPVFTEMVVQMVGVGEESGDLDGMLDKVAEMYELEVNSTVEALTSLLEPLLIVAMGVTVGGILMSVYLPMFKAISLVK